MRELLTISVLDDEDGKDFSAVHGGGKPRIGAFGRTIFDVLSSPSSREGTMKKTVYVCPIKGDDKYDGLSERLPVRSIARARDIAAKINADEIRIFAVTKSSWISEELANEEKRAT